MVRALDIDASDGDIVGVCAKRNIPISTIEALASSGTRAATRLDRA